MIQTFCQCLPDCLAGGYRKGGREQKVKQLFILVHIKV